MGVYPLFWIPVCCYWCFYVTWGVQCNSDKRTKRCLSSKWWVLGSSRIHFLFFRRVLAPVDCADPLQLFLCLPPPPGQAEDTAAAKTERDQSDRLQRGLQLSIVNAGPQYVYWIRLFEFTYLSYCCCSCQVSCWVGEHLVPMPGSWAHFKLCNISLLKSSKIVPLARTHIFTQPRVQRLEHVIFDLFYKMWQCSSFGGSCSFWLWDT